MIIADQYQQTSDEDSSFDLEVLFDRYNIPDDVRSLYREQISSVGIEKVIEYVIRDLPDGFSRGSFRLLDINRQLDQKGC